MKRLQKGFTAIEFALVMGGVIALAGVIASVWVIAHFLCKFW